MLVWYMSLEKPVEQTKTSHAYLESLTKAHVCLGLMYTRYKDVMHKIYIKQMKKKYVTL